MSSTATSKMQEVPSIDPHHVYTDGASWKMRTQITFFGVSMRIRVNGPPCACQWTPPLRKKKHGPLCKCPPPLERRNTAQAIDMGGGGTVFLCSKSTL